jgi:hypothetical protein
MSKLCYRENGLYKIRSNFSYSGVFSHLEKDDELFWLDTWIPDLFNHADAFCEALKRGVSNRSKVI